MYVAVEGFHMNFGTEKAYMVFPINEAVPAGFIITKIVAVRDSHFAALVALTDCVPPSQASALAAV